MIKVRHVIDSNPSLLKDKIEVRDLRYPSANNNSVIDQDNFHPWFHVLSDSLDSRDEQIISLEYSPSLHNPLPLRLHYISKPLHYAHSRYCSDQYWNSSKGDNPPVAFALNANFIARKVQIKEESQQV